MATVTQVQIQDESALHITLILSGMNWIHLFFLEQWVKWKQPVWEKENSDFKPVKLRLKFLIVSYPSHAEGLDTHEYTWLSEVKVLQYLDRYIDRNEEKEEDI